MYRVEKTPNQLDPEMLTQFKKWIRENHRNFTRSIVEIFKENCKSHPEYWNLGDYIRWLESKDNWTLNIQFGSYTIRAPLNLLCLLGIE